MRRAIENDPASQKMIQTNKRRRTKASREGEGIKETTKRIQGAKAKLYSTEKRKENGKMERELKREYSCVEIIRKGNS